jgi:cyclopropane-fatty-acyl-phospholipid synthase
VRLVKTALRLVERGLVPDALSRRGIRRLLRERLRAEALAGGGDPERALAEHVEAMRSGPIALVPEAANAQHYELPSDFFELVLGRRLKYSSAFYRAPETTLDEAEEAMLALTCERARLADGQDVLELGCGWGSLTLWMAERYPASRILAVSNSASQRRSILSSARVRGLANVDVVTCDMNAFDPARRFDRVVSVEMFEHMRDWETLLRRVAGWLRPDGKLFLHFFAHARHAYPFTVRDESDWMSRYFFTGGMMPSRDLVQRLEVPFELEELWDVPGTHYARTAEDWLANLDRRRDDVLAILYDVYGERDAALWLRRWRLFFLACAELFGFRGGVEWLVVHQTLVPRSAR